MSKNQAFMIDVKDSRNRSSVTSVEKKLMEFLEAVWPLQVHVKVLTTFIFLFCHNSSI